MSYLKNDLLLRTLKGESVERPPVWMMRQAGRILPEYREVRAALGSFKNLVETPAKAAEVTIQPVEILNVDAAIIFSDILVVPDAMNLHYEMKKGEGPYFPKTFTSKEDLSILDKGTKAAEKLEYVFEAIRITKEQLAGEVPLIGFAGAPWTIFAYMIEGEGSKTFSKAKKFLYEQPELSHELLQAITDTTIAYLKLQINAGVDVIQIFDSWAALLGPAQYREFSLPYINQIGNSISEVPKIAFPKGAWSVLEDFNNSNFDAISLDWLVEPKFAREKVGESMILQGNLDPCNLYADPESITSTTIKMIKDFGNKHIVNLGHGVYPDTPLTGVKAFIDTVKNYRY